MCWRRTFYHTPAGGRHGTRLRALESIAKAAGVDCIVGGDRVYAGDPVAAVPFEHVPPPRVEER